MLPFRSSFQCLIGSLARHTPSSYFDMRLLFDRAIWWSGDELA